MPPILAEEAEKEMEELLKHGIVQKSRSAWNSPLVVVGRKPDAAGRKRYRVCVDFRAVNKVISQDNFPLPNVLDLFDKLEGAKFFITLDLKAGFHAIEIDPRDRHKTAFSTRTDHLEFTRMCFGLRNASAEFQRMINILLISMQNVLVFIDDILIFSKTMEGLEKTLIEVMERLRKANLLLQPEKCVFLREEMPYLGHIISKDGCRPDPAKISAVEIHPRICKNSKMPDGSTEKGRTIRLDPRMPEGVRNAERRISQKTDPTIPRLQ